MSLSGQSFSLVKKAIDAGNTPEDAEARLALQWVLTGTRSPKNPLNERPKQTGNDPFFPALAKMIQAIFLAIGQELNHQPDPEALKKLKMLNDNLLTFYPYAEPSDQSDLTIYQESETGWDPCVGKVKEFNLAPKTGVLAVLPHRHHAYAFVPVNQGEAILLFGGTPFKRNRHGSRLAHKHNFTPGHSPGEAHDRTEVDTWIAEMIALNKKFSVGGHSQGSALAQIIAALYPKFVSRAFGYSVTALAQATLDRLLPGWMALPENERPPIELYTLKGDIIAIFHKGYLPGTVLREIDFDRSTLSLLEFILSKLMIFEIPSLGDIQQELYENLQDFHVSSGILNASFRCKEISKQDQVLSAFHHFMTKTATLGAPLIYYVHHLKHYLEARSHKPGAVIKSNKTLQFIFSLGLGSGLAIGASYAAVLISFQFIIRFISTPNQWSHSSHLLTQISEAHNMLSRGLHLVSGSTALIRRQMIGLTHSSSSSKAALPKPDQPSSTVKKGSQLSQADLEAAYRKQLNESIKINPDPQVPVANNGVKLIPKDEPKEDEPREFIYGFYS